MTVRNEIAGAGLFFAERKVEALMLAEARRRLVTRMFGIPGDEQSLLVTMILAGSAATVVGRLLARPLPRPSGDDAAIGAAVLDTTIGALAGGASRAGPLAGGLITFAVIAHAVRPVTAGSARKARATARRLRAAYDNRYAT